jgi:hypothetical protein
MAADLENKRYQCIYLKAGLTLSVYVVTVKNTTNEVT